MSSVATLPERAPAEAREKSNLGEFLADLVEVADPRTGSDVTERAINRLQHLHGAKRALNGNDGTSGGYALPVNYYDELLLAVNRISIVRPRATVVQVSAVTTPIPMLDQATNPTGGYAAAGGMVTSWGPTGAGSTETSPTLQQGSLTVHELTGYMEASVPLAKLSRPAMATIFKTVAAEAIAAAEDAAFLLGGPARPIGITTSGAMITTATRSSGSALTLADVLLVLNRLPASSRNRAVFVLSQLAEKTVIAGTGAANGLANAGAITADAEGQLRLLGRPLLITDLLGAFNTLGDLMALDLSRYLIGDFGMPEIAVSVDHKFRESKVAFRTWQMTGGIPWTNKAAILPDGSTTISPFVQLGI
ncbi:MAG: phage major capsid protein [Isosphaeraceae bacterium]